jgi:hypothetical protein
MLPLNTPEAIVCAELPLKTMVPEEALITPFVRLILPFIVWVEEPILYVPFVSVRAVVIVVLAAVVTPAELLIVRLFTLPLNTPEAIVCAELPLKIIVPDAALITPEVLLMLPLMVWVLLPIL